MAHEDARMRAARLFREAVTRDPSLYKEFAPKFQTVGLDISMGAPKGWTLPAAPDTSPGPFGDRNMPRPRPDMPPGFTAADDPYLARQNMLPPASGLAPDAPFMANPAVAAGAMQPASSLYPGFTQAPDRERAAGSPFTLGTRARLDAATALRSGQSPIPASMPIQPNMGQRPDSPGPAVPGGTSGFSPPSPLTGMTGPPSPLASRFGDQSQRPGDVLRGGLPPLPQPRPFESQIAARPMPPGGPGSLPAAPPAMASGPPIPTSVATQGGFKPAPGFDQALRSVPPPASLPPLSPAAMDARVGAVSPETTLPPSAMDARVGATTPSAALSPLQRAPLNLAAGAGLSGPPPPLGSTNMAFAGIPPTPASVAQRTEILGPLARGAGTGVPVRSVQTPLIGVPPASGTVPPVGPVPGQDLPAPPAAPTVPAVEPPSMIASIPPANVQAGNLNDVLALSGDAPPPAITPTVTGQRTAGTPRGKGVRQATAAPPAAPKPGIVNAPNIGTVVGGVAGLVAGGPGGAVAGAGGGRILGKIISAIRSHGQNVDAKGNIIDKAGNIIGHVSDKLGGIFGHSGSSVSGGNWNGGSRSGGGGGYGYSGGGGAGGQYGGGGGWNIRDSIGGAYRNR